MASSDAVGGGDWEAARQPRGPRGCIGVIQPQRWHPGACAVNNCRLPSGPIHWQACEWGRRVPAGRCGAAQCGAVQYGVVQYGAVQCSHPLNALLAEVHVSGGGPQSAGQVAGLEGVGVRLEGVHPLRAQ
jgi:hypothetical protein